MKNQFVARVVKALFATPARKEPNAGHVPPKAVGRSLGYTEKELSIALEVLDRFDWQRPAEQSDRNEEATEEKAGQPGSDRNQAA
jgi:hypothetical protein